ncbi:MAG: HD domain-containing protein [Anaerolineales bacterium]
MISLESVRIYYPANDIVHGFDHVQRVLALAKILSEKEKANWEIVQAAVLLHDAQPPKINPPSADRIKDQRTQHQADSASLATQLLSNAGWDAPLIEAVIHCIRSHRFRNSSEKPATLEAQIVFDADKLDAIGAVGVARAIAYATQHGEPFFAAPSQQFCESGVLVAGERHSAYHEFIYKLNKLPALLYTNTARQLAQERKALMIQFFEHLKQECELSEITERLSS